MRCLLLVFSIVVISCSSEIKKPDNLIAQDKMLDIFYDLAVMDAIKSHNPLSLETFGIQPDQYIYKKYDIDSLQFATSNTYYASDIQQYKTMYAQVNDRLKSEKSEVDKLLKAEGKPGDLEEIVPVEKSSARFVK